QTVEWTALPQRHVFDDLVGDLRDRLPADLGAVDLQQVRLNVAGGHALRIQRDHIPGQAIETSLMLRDGLRIERAVAVPRDRQLNVPDISRDPLARRPLAAVAAPAAGR